MPCCRVILVALFIALLPSMAGAEDNVSWGDHASNVTISSDGLTVTGTTGGFGSARANIGRSDGCRAFEIEITSVAGSSRFGIGDATFSLASYLGTSANSLGVWNLNVSPVAGGFSKIGADSSPAQVVGTRYAFIIRFDLKKGWIKRNDVFRTAGADVTAGTGADFSFTVTTPLYPAVSSYSPGDGMKLRTKSADLAVTMPAGCVSWATTDGSAPPPPPPPIGNSGIAFAGDSITWYMDQPPNSSASIYSFSPTFNAGVPSETSAGLHARTDAIVALKPKMAFVLTGVNDYPLGLTRQQTVDNILGIVRKFVAAGITVYVEGILPVGPGYPNYGGASVMNAEAAARNAMIKAALKNEPGGLYYEWGSSLVAADYMADQIHLVGSGFVKRFNAASALIVPIR